MAIAKPRRRQTLHWECKEVIKSRRKAVYDAQENIRKTAKELAQWYGYASAVAAYLPTDTIAYKDVKLTSKCPRCEKSLDATPPFGSTFKRCIACKLSYYALRHFGPRTSVSKKQGAWSSEKAGSLRAGTRGKETLWEGGTGGPITHMSPETQVKRAFCDVCQQDREFRLYRDGPVSQRNYFACRTCGTQIKLGNRPRPIYEPRKIRDLKEFGKEMAQIDTSTPEIDWGPTADGKTMIGLERIGTLPQGNPIYRMYFQSVSS